MPFDAHKNFAYSLVALAPSPASSGTTLTVHPGDGPKFPTPPFNAVVWPVGSLPLSANAEVVRVTAIIGDVLTFVRSQEGATARTILIGDQVSAAITAKTLTDVEGAVLTEAIRAQDAEATLLSGLTAETGRAQTAEDSALAKASNLSDVASVATARANLGLGSAAVQASSAFDAAGAAAAEATRAQAAEALALLKGNNLSDVADVATARKNLGIDTTSITGTQGLLWDASSSTFLPASLVAQPSGMQDGDILVRSSGSWARLARGSTGQQMLARSDGTIGWVDPPEFNAKGWFAKGDNATNDFPAIASAVSAGMAAAASGPGGYVVRIPGGKFLLNGASGGGAGTMTFPPNLIGNVILKGSGRGVTKLVCSANVPSFLSNGATVAGDTLQGVSIEDMTIDGHNVNNGSNSGIALNISAPFVNVDAIKMRGCEIVNGGALSAVRRCVTINVSRNDAFGVPFLTTLAANVSAGASTVSFVSAPAMATGMQFTLGTGGGQETLTIQSVSGTTVTVTTPLANAHTTGEVIAMLPVAQNTMTNIELDDVEIGFTGGAGATGVFIGAFCNPAQASNDIAYFGQTLPAANVVLDRIHLNKVRARSLTDATSFSASAGIQCVGDGWGKRVTLRDCYTRGFGDVNVEIDSTETLLVDGLYSENGWNSNFLLSNNHGGLAFAQRQTVHLHKVTCVRSVSTSSNGAGISLSSLHGTKFGTVFITEPTFRHTAPQFLSGGGGFINPSNAPIDLRGQWKRIVVRNPKVIYDNLAIVGTANNLTWTPCAVQVQQMGDTGMLEVKGTEFEFNGSGDQGSFTGCALQADVIKFDFASRLMFDIEGVQPRTNFQRLNGLAFRMREVNFSFGAQTMTDTFATAGTLTTQYLVDAGAVSDLAQGSSVVTSVANHTTRKRFRVWNFQNATTGAPKNQAGRTMDGSIYVWGTVDPAGPAGFELVVPLRVSDDGTSCVQAVLADDGSSSTLRIEKVTGGTPTVMAGPTTLTRMTGGQTVGLRLKQQANSLTADYFSSPGSPPAYTTAGTTTLAYTLAAGTEAQTWGADGVPGYVGWGWTPGAAGATFLGVRYDRLHVVSGNINRLQPLGNRQSATVTNGIVFNANSTNMRFEGILECRDWSRGPTKKDAPADINGADATQKGQIRVGGVVSLASPPVASSVTITTGTFTWVNQTMFPGYFETRAGTFTTPFVRTLKAGDAAFVQRTGVSGENRIWLDVGDTIELTTTGTVPTAQFVPVLT